MGKLKESISYAIPLQLRKIVSVSQEKSLILEMGPTNFPGEAATALTPPPLVLSMELNLMLNAKSKTNYFRLNCFVNFVH